jgi:hypothetical protein
MTTSELKLHLFRKIDALSAERLQEVYGKIINFLNSQDDINEWDSMSQVEQKAIMDGIEQLDEGKTISHQTVLSEARKKYSNG